MPTVLFLCSGNYCRSPIAEALTRLHLRQAGLAESITVRSAGTTDNYAGQAPAPLVVEVLREVGADGSNHRPHLAQPDELANADLILGVAHVHVAWVKHNYPALSARTHLLSHLLGESWDIFDPGVEELDAVRECRDSIDRIIVKGLNDMLRRLQLSSKSPAAAAPSAPARHQPARG